jgi:hypothetical protein
MLDAFYQVQDSNSDKIPALRLKTNNKSQNSEVDKDLT